MAKYLDILNRYDIDKSILLGTISKSYLGKVISLTLITNKYLPTSNFVMYLENNHKLFKDKFVQPSNRALNFFFSIVFFCKVFTMRYQNLNTWLMF